MNRFALTLILAGIALAACAPQQGPQRATGGRPLKPVAEPSKVIAADIAFNQLALEKGQWTAFRETAAPGAEMFAPQRVKAADWLKGKLDPTASVRWQPRAVWSSCDGSSAVTSGEWQRPGSTGSYVTVWQRQKDGAYKWLLDISIGSEKSASAPDMIAAKVAECSGKPLGVAVAVGGQAGRLADTVTNAATDGTLRWTSTVLANSQRSFQLRMWDGQDLKTVIDFEEASSGQGVR